jgi:hypothetical protein
MDSFSRQSPFHFPAVLKSPDFETGAAGWQDHLTFLL